MVCLVVPVVVGFGYSGNVFIGKIFCPAVNQITEIAGIDKQNFVQTAFFPARQEPETGGYLRIQKEFCRKVDDAVKKSGFNNGFPYFAFTVGFGSKRTLGQHKACHAFVGDM